VSCVRCGGSCEEGALICDACADACFEEPRFFLNPVLVGPSIFSRLRSEGSAACLLGPVSVSDIVWTPSLEYEDQLEEVALDGLDDDGIGRFLETCNTLLAHLGVPLKKEGPSVLLTEDASDIIQMIVRKIERSPDILSYRSSSDLFLRLGVVYWISSHGILLRTASPGWRTAKYKALVAKARAYFSKVKPKDDLYSIALWNLGMLCAEAGAWDDARDNLTLTLEIFPDDLLVAEALIRSEIELGDAMTAMAMVDEHLSQQEVPSLWVLKGRVLVSMGRHEDALECFNRALTLDPTHTAAHDLAIDSLRRLDRPEDVALAERQRELARKPDLERKVMEFLSELSKPPAEGVVRPKPAPHAPPPPPEPEPEEPLPPSPEQLARSALIAGELDMAIQRARHILEADPSSIDGHLVLIEALVEKGALSDAGTCANRFYESHRENPLAWYWRGMVASKEGKWGAAVQYFSKAVTLDPGLSAAWVAMGNTLLDQKKLSGADESYSRALQTDNDNAEAWLGKGRAMHGMGRWGAAIQCLDKYNSLAPEDPEGWLLKADILFEKEKHRRAIDAYDRFLRHRPDDSHALARKGISLNAIGMVDEARECLEHSVRLDSSNKEAAHWLDSISGGGGH
jgi:tetratricopeptide (TPR) repeat protein